MALLSVKQNAKFWGFSESWIYRHWHELGGFKIGTRIKFDIEEQKELLSKYKGNSRKWLTAAPSLNTNNQRRIQLTKVRSLAFVKDGECIAGTVYERNSKRGTRWYSNIHSKNGRVRQVIKDARSEAEAMEALQVRLKETYYREYSVSRPKEDTIFKDVAALYIETYAKVRKKSWRTDEKYLSAQLIPYFGEMKVSEIRSLDVDRFIAKRKEDEVKNSTINKELTVLKKIMALAQEWEFGVEKNPVRRARYFSEEEYRRERVLSYEEEERLFKAAAPHLHSILTCALQTAMRLGEILSLKWKNVDLEKRQLTIRPESSKSGRSRTIPVNNTLSNLLDELGRANDGKSEFVFLYDDPKIGKPRPIKYVQHSFTAACRRAGIQSLTFHDLRHTAASRMIAKGANPVSVKNILGHSSLRTSEIYFHSNLEQMQKAVSLLSENVTFSHIFRHKFVKGKRKKLVNLPFSLN